MMMSRYTRAANRSDLLAIVQLLNAAFSPSTYESRIVLCMDAGRSPHFGWVTIEETSSGGSELVGYVLYSVAFAFPVGSDDAKTRTGAIGWHLGPLGVHPLYQRQGIGSELIRHSLAQPPLAYEPVFVLGDPSYYERFGFAALRNPDCPYNPGNSHFRALRWKDEGTPSIAGYDAAFKDAEMM